MEENGKVLISIKGFSKEAKKAYGKDWTDKDSYKELTSKHGQPVMIDDKGNLYWKMDETSVPVKEE